MKRKISMVLILIISTGILSGCGDLKQEKDALVKQENTKENTSSNLSSQSEELDDMTEIKDTSKASKTEVETVIRADELKAGDLIDGYEITNIENSTDKFSVALKGEIMIEGDFMLSDMYSTYITFIGSDSAINQPFKTLIEVNNQTMTLSTNLGVRNDEVIKEQLGEELYARFGEEIKNDKWLKVHAVAVFDTYSTSAYWESEITTYANLIKVIDYQVIEE